MPDVQPTFRIPYPYPAQLPDCFDGLADQTGAVLLDSCGLAHGGRYSLVSAFPRVFLEWSCGEARVTQGGRIESLRIDDPLGWLRQQQQARRTAKPADLPFASGVIGSFGYDLGRWYEGLVDRLPRYPEQGPVIAAGFYDFALVVDHHLRQASLVGVGDPETEIFERFRDHLVLGLEARNRPEIPPLRALERPHQAPDDAAYAQAFERIQRYIREGDCYQVNLARRYGLRVTGDPWQAYKALRRSTPVPFAAYLNHPRGQLISLSPERFLRLRDRLVETWPIKGTRRRDPDPARDLALAAELQQSTKDRAENLMIVDLLRNDLGRCCRPGSIRVPRLFALESFPAVHHLVSQITGELAQGEDAWSLLRACLPGGSITGAPKIRAMQIIEELESAARGFYCGCIGYIDDGGDMDTNIAIRTLRHGDGKLEFFGGGGLVADSELARELQEIRDKVAPFTDFLRSSFA